MIHSLLAASFLSSRVILLTSRHPNPKPSSPERLRSLVKPLQAHPETNIFTNIIRSSNSLTLSGFKPEIKGLFPNPSVLRRHHYLLESRTRYAPRTSHPLTLPEIRPSHPAILYNISRLTTGSMKHNDLISALPSPFLMGNTRTGAKHVPNRSQNAISSSMHPPQCRIRGPPNNCDPSTHAKKHDRPF